MNTNTDRDPPTWMVIAGMVVFAALYLLWAYAFDAVSRWFRGSWIDDVLNVITSPWPWVALVLIYAVGSVVMKRFNKTT